MPNKVNRALHAVSADLTLEFTDNSKIAPSPWEPSRGFLCFQDIDRQNIVRDLGEEMRMDCSDQLLFDENRIWSPDHASIVFSARSGDRHIRFFLPRSCLTNLSGAAPVSPSTFLKFFDESFDELEQAARAAYRFNKGFSSAYVLSQEAIETARENARFEAPKLAA